MRPGPVLRLYPLTGGRTRVKTTASPSSPLCSVKGSRTPKTQGAQGSGTVDVPRFSPNGDRFSACQSHLDVSLTCAPTPVVREANHVHLVRFLPGQGVEPFNVSCSPLGSVWVVRSPWGQEPLPIPQGTETPQGCHLHGPGDVGGWLPFTHQALLEGSVLLEHKTLGRDSLRATGGVLPPVHEWRPGGSQERVGPHQGCRAASGRPSPGQPAQPRTPAVGLARWWPLPQEGRAWLTWMRHFLRGSGLGGLLRTGLCPSRPVA